MIATKTNPVAGMTPEQYAAAEQSFSALFGAYPLSGPFYGSNSPAALNTASQVRRCWRHSHAGWGGAGAGGNLIRGGGGEGDGTEA